MVYNGTMRGINTLMIMGRDSAKVILGGRIREARWEDFPNALEPFVQLIYQKKVCELESTAEMEEHKSPRVDGKSLTPFSLNFTYPVWSRNTTAAGYFSFKTKQNKTKTQQENQTGITSVIYLSNQVQHTHLAAHRAC